LFQNKKQMTKMCNLTVCNLTVCNLPVCNLPVCNLPVCNLPVCNIPVCNLTVCNLPVCNLPVGSLPVCNLPVGSLPVPSLPVLSLPVCNLKPTCWIFPSCLVVSNFTSATIGMGSMEHRDSAQPIPMAQFGYCVFPYETGVCWIIFMSSKNWK